MAHPCAPSVVMIVLGLIGLAFFVRSHLLAQRQSTSGDLLP